MESSIWPIKRMLEFFPKVKTLLQLSLVSLVAPLPPIGGTINILPLPSSYSTGNATVCLDFTLGNFPITLSGDYHPADLSSSIERLRHDLTEINHVYLSPTLGVEFFPYGIENGCEMKLHSLELKLTSPLSSGSISQDTLKPIEERIHLESYTLTINHGRGVITAPSWLGLHRGLTTFKQLWYRQNQVLFAPFGPYWINDKPQFGWRSVMLDTSRHFLSVDTLKRQIEAMAFVKLNVLHWHITDSHSWPLDLKDFPDLVKGSYPLSVYTEEDVKEVMEYAAERGIDVLLEIDTPGHTASLIHSHPDFIACYDHPHLSNANEPPAGQARFVNNTVVSFFQDLFRSVTRLTKSLYVGTGGDEINVNCMMNDEETTRLLDSKGWTLDHALDEFTKKTHAVLRTAEKTPTVWQEMVLEHDTTLPKDTIIHIWRANQDAKKVLDRGYRIIHGSSDYFYLDCGMGGWMIDQSGDGKSWCDPFKPWDRIYTFDPYLNITLDQRDRVLGGQVSLWAEQVDETNLETLLWPRAASLAEVFWTRPGESGYPFDPIKALPRMHDVRYRLVEMGIRAVPIQPRWCAFHPGRCNLDS